MKKNKIAVCLLLTALLVGGCQSNTGSADVSQSDGEEQSVSSGMEASSGETAEKNEEAASEETQSDLFSDFINNNGSLLVSGHFQQANQMTEIPFQAGEEYTFESLLELLHESEYLSDVQPEVEYAYLDYPYRKAYAISLYFKTATEGITQFFILSEADGRLEMDFAIDGWSRRNPVITASGVVWDSGSAGAGSHLYTTYVPDRDFEYKMLSDVEENAYGFYFYDPDDSSVDTLNAIMEEAGNGNEDAMGVLYYREEVDGEIYYYFLGGDGSISQELVDYIDGIAAEHGFTFDGKAAASEAKQSYVQRLGAEEYYDRQDEAEWVR